MVLIHAVYASVEGHAIDETGSTHAADQGPLLLVSDLEAAFRYTSVDTAAIVRLQYRASQLVNSRQLKRIPREAFGQLKVTKRVLYKILITCHGKGLRSQVVQLRRTSGFGRDQTTQM